MKAAFTVLVVPVRGDPYRMTFAERPPLVLVRRVSVLISPCWWVDAPKATMTTTEVRYRLHLTALGACYVERG